MAPKMGPHLGLKTGPEKMKADSRASLFPAHFLGAKTDPKTRPFFDHCTCQKQCRLQHFL